MQHAPSLLWVGRLGTRLVWSVVKATDIATQVKGKTDQLSGGATSRVDLLCVRTVDNQQVYFNVSEHHYNLSCTVIPKCYISGGQKPNHAV